MLDINDYLKISEIAEVKTDKYGNEISRVYNLAFKDNNEFLKDWMFFDKKINGNNGVYMIGDFYIGQTQDLRSRLLRHIKPVIINSKNQQNQDLSNIFRYNLSNGLVMPVIILSKRHDLEQYYINKYKKLNYPLVNKAYGIGIKFALEVI